MDRVDTNQPLNWAFEDAMGPRETRWTVGFGFTHQRSRFDTVRAHQFWRYARSPALSLICRYGKVEGVGEHPGFQSASAARTAPPVGPLPSDQQPATKADLYAAVDALRADMRQLLDEVRTLIQEADRATGRAGPNPHFDDDAW
jgi:hypothetical protein